MAKRKRKPDTRKGTGARRRRRRRTSDTRNERGQFLPGVSGNPNGRPARGMMELRQALEQIEIEEDGAPFLGIAECLYEMARRSEAGMRLYLEYRVGRPMPIDFVDDPLPTVPSESYRVRFTSRAVGVPAESERREQSPQPATPGAQDDGKLN